jgi:cysteine-rich repeat protein
LIRYARRSFGPRAAVVLVLGLAGCGSEHNTRPSPAGSAGASGAGAAGASDAGSPEGAAGSAGTSGPIDTIDASRVPSADAGNDEQAIPTCGDGLINRAGEACDDGNTAGGDGCPAQCDQIEANYACDLAKLG